MASDAALDAACVSRVLAFLEDDADAVGSALRVCRLWRSSARDSALPFWGALDAARFGAVHRHGARAAFCKCAVAAVLRSGVGRRLRRLDLSGVTACEACRASEVSVAAQPLGYFEVALTPLHRQQAGGGDASLLAELCVAGRAQGA